jgi:CYTH domain-containing protein
MAPALEIERKYLLAHVPDLAHPALSDVERWRIEQVFLAKDSDWSRRVRRVTLDDGSERYYYTRKRRLSRLAREEDESEIDAAEYASLLAEQSPEHLPLLKTRLIFKHAGRKWELDLFERYPTMVILEVELEREDEEVSPPAFLGPAREVTEEKDYTSRSLAQRDTPAVARPHEHA